MHHTAIFLNFYCNSFCNAITELFIWKNLFHLDVTSHEGGINIIPGLYDGIISHWTRPLPVCLHAKVLICRTFFIVYSVPYVDHIILYFRHYVFIKTIPTIKTNFHFNPLFLILTVQQNYYHQNNYWFIVPKVIC